MIDPYMFDLLDIFLLIMTIVLLTIIIVGIRKDHKKDNDEMAQKNEKMDKKDIDEMAKRMEDLEKKICWLYLIIFL